MCSNGMPLHGNAADAWEPVGVPVLSEEDVAARTKDPEEKEYSSSDSESAGEDDLAPSR